MNVYGIDIVFVYCIDILYMMSVCSPRASQSPPPLKWAHTAHDRARPLHQIISRVVCRWSLEKLEAPL